MTSTKVDPLTPEQVHRVEVAEQRQRAPHVSGTGLMRYLAENVQSEIDDAVGERDKLIQRIHKLNAKIAKLQTVAMIGRDEGTGANAG